MATVSSPASFSFRLVRADSTLERSSSEILSP